MRFKKKNGARVCYKNSDSCSCYNLEIYSFSYSSRFCWRVFFELVGLSRLKFQFMEKFSDFVNYIVRLVFQNCSRLLKPSLILRSWKLPFHEQARLISKGRSDERSCQCCTPARLPIGRSFCHRLQKLCTTRLQYPTGAF